MQYSMKKCKTQLESRHGLPAPRPPGLASFLLEFWTFIGRIPAEGNDEANEWIPKRVSQIRSTWRQESYLCS